MNPINVQQMNQLRKNGYRVCIKHTVLDTPVRLRNGISVKGITNCFINGNDGFAHGEGESFCLASDQFNKNMGSSLAFSRAIGNLNITRSRAKTLLTVNPSEVSERMEMSMLLGVPFSMI